MIIFGIVLIVFGFFMARVGVSDKIDAWEGVGMAVAGIVILAIGILLIYLGIHFH